MKTRIHYTTLNKDSEPIVIENLQVFKNCVGQWTLTFDSVNHKYLEEYGTISGSFFKDGVILYETGIEFCTYETFVDPSYDTWVGWDSFIRIDSNGGHFGKFRWLNSDTRKFGFFGKNQFENQKVELPNQRVEIYLIPETKEEEEELNGTFCFLPLKWCYEIVCVPYNHFGNPKYTRKSDEFEVVN